MPEVTIEKPEDLKKFIGWTIRDCTLHDMPVRLRLILHHHLAEHEAILYVIPASDLVQVNKETMTIRQGFTLRYQDKPD